MTDPRRRNRPSARISRITDPLTPSGREVALGGAPLSPPQNVIERGTVISVDAQRHIYRVHLNSGRTMMMSRIRSHEGDVTLLHNGTIVIVTFALGLPYIMGVLPPETSGTYDDNPTSITDTNGHGGNDDLLSRNLGANSRGANEPVDVAPGDFVGTSHDGASVAALHGKVAQIRGSALAKVQAFGDNDLVQIVAGIMRTITWMGESQIVNNGGKTSFIWRGGADQLTQTGSDEEKYTIRLDAGDTGNLIKLEVCNRDNQTVFRFHVDPQGHAELFAAGGFNQHSGSDDGQIHPINYHGHVEETITGTATRRIAGDVTITYEGNTTETVSSNLSVTVGQDYIAQVNRDKRVNVGGDDTLIVTGKTHINSRGEFKVEILDPGEIHGVKTNGGDSTIETQSGNHTVTTTGGIIKMDPGEGQFQVPAGDDCIILGSNATDHGTKWEPLDRTLRSFIQSLNNLHTLIATHVHSGSSPSPTLTPLSSPLSLDISGAKSTSTKLN